MALGLAHDSPAVIAFTSAIAAAAVGEFLDRLIGFKSSEPKSSEFIYRFDSDDIRRNSLSPKQDCFRTDRNNWGIGDRKRFDLTGERRHEVDHTQLAALGPPAP
jgi:hypothetical protein